MNKSSLLISAGFVFVSVWASNAQSPTQSSAAQADQAPTQAQTGAPQAATKEVAVIKTSKGEITVEFWEDVAPKTVANFKKLSREGFYNGTAFHRIIKGFMIQGGDPNTKDPSKEGIYGTGNPGYQIKAEFNDRKHERGVLSMARSADPDSAGSQFFICLDAAPFLDGKYTTFGRVVKGEEVLMAIGETPVASNGRERSRPTERVAVESVSVVSSPAAAPQAPK